MFHLSLVPDDLQAVSLRGCGWYISPSPLVYALLSEPEHHDHHCMQLMCAPGTTIRHGGRLTAATHTASL